MYDRDSYSSCDHLNHSETPLYCSSRVDTLCFLLCTEFQHASRNWQEKCKTLIYDDKNTKEESTIGYYKHSISKQLHIISS